MRISDWSSDVCSSDLLGRDGSGQRLQLEVGHLKAPRPDPDECRFSCDKEFRSEERRVGKECVSTCRSRGSTDRDNTKKNHSLCDICHVYPTQSQPTNRIGSLYKDTDLDNNRRP